MIASFQELNKSHPEWHLRVPGSVQAERNEMVLDLSKIEVEDYLFNSIESILSRYTVVPSLSTIDNLCSAKIDYIKWDMNRPLTEVFSQKTALDGEEIFQSEMHHRYVLGLYRLQERIKTAFPNVLLENCASGG
jgi:alpha-galactosidase